MNPTFTCSNCGGTLEYAGDGTQTITCSYCGTMAAVPEELWRPIEMAHTAQAVNRWTKYIIAFVVIMIAVPTCLGVVGTLLGIGGSIIGIIVAVLAPLFPFLFQ